MKLPKESEHGRGGRRPRRLDAGSVRTANVDVVVLDKVPEAATPPAAVPPHPKPYRGARRVGRRDTARCHRRCDACAIFTVRDRERVLARLDFSQLPTPYPYTLMLPQSRAEAIMAARLAELDGSRPWTVTAVAETALGAASPERGVFQARYVVGAERARRRGPSGPQIGFSGDRYNVLFVLADIQLDWPLPTDEVQLLCLTRRAGRCCTATAVDGTASSTTWTMRQKHRVPG